MLSVFSYNDVFSMHNFYRNLVKKLFNHAQKLCNSGAEDCLQIATDSMASKRFKNLPSNAHHSSPPSNAHYMIRFGPQLRLALRKEKKNEATKVKTMIPFNATKAHNQAHG